MRLIEWNDLLSQIKTVWNSKNQFSYLNYVCLHVICVQLFDAELPLLNAILGGEKACGKQIWWISISLRTEGEREADTRSKIQEIN